MNIYHIFYRMRISSENLSNSMCINDKNVSVSPTAQSDSCEHETSVEEQHHTSGNVEIIGQIGNFENQTITGPSPSHSMCALFRSTTVLFIKPICTVYSVHSHRTTYTGHVHPQCTCTMYPHSASLIVDSAVWYRYFIILLTKYIYKPVQQRSPYT